MIETQAAVAINETFVQQLAYGIINSLDDLLERGDVATGDKGDIEA
ncbi:TPA: hypothetical protein HA246_04750 [Candidatus Woesearchaeota archaeon]|nr:hypothetical protein [Candidatus Woesearchaeota archaeon]